jgi:DNA topoisomerase-2
VPKKAALPKIPKPASKKKVQTTIKATKPVTKKRPKLESDDEDDEPPSDLDPFEASGLSNTPPSAKKQKKAPAPKNYDESDIENDSMMSGPSKKAPTKKKSATEQYQRLTQLEHIIKRPDTYIGSVERTQESMWVFNSETSQMEMRKVSFVPGLYKIFDEILVNAADNKQRDPTMKVIKVMVDREKGQISVENDGNGIPVEIHKVSQYQSCLL